MEGLFTHKCHEVGYAKLAFEKSDCSQEIPAPKKVLLLKNIAVEELSATEKFMFRIITYSEEVAPPKQQLHWKVLIFKQ